MDRMLNSVRVDVCESIPLSITYTRNEIQELHRDLARVAEFLRFIGSRMDAIGNSLGIATPASEVPF